ncbi:hypothetical protein [Clostridium botulinum]|nr:hypothetical protein [Clostridium botulinum]MCD3275574.1 hypothetical protein [Clostridium botulinum C/D]MCD3286498.1 hypothetical protein [Clostridium botulinum C/D]MCD3291467.1 hypothetical protein [Clostridium botulinum C/D]MCD3303817.1 hypothetical protein [Clostridium botulinum C/D]
MNQELIRILNKCNDYEITALRINVDERYFIGEDKEGRISVFKFRDFVNENTLK